MCLLTCKEFLSELNDFLDDTLRAEIRQKFEDHLAECPNCWVIFDTTKKTILVYKGMEPQPIPQDIHSRLMEALNRKLTAGGGGSA